MSEIASVELRFADEEPVRSFIAAVSTAYERFAEASPEDLQGLPAAIAEGILGMQDAVAILAGPVLMPPAGNREEPSCPRGAVIIEWPEPAPLGVGAISARMVTVYDAFTGGDPGPKPITTVSAITVRVTMDEIVTADLTMFADEHGEPILDGQPLVRDGEILTGVFPFLVSEMRVKGE